MSHNRLAPVLDLDATACGRPEEYDADKKFKGKKVVLVSVPGTLFTTPLFTRSKLILDRRFHTRLLSLASLMFSDNASED